jgi:signal transduction histidine kinase
MNQLTKKFSSIPFPRRGIVVGVFIFGCKALAESAILQMMNAATASFGTLLLSNMCESLLFGCLALMLWYVTMAAMHEVWWKQVLVQLVGCGVYAIGGFWLNGLIFILRIGFVPSGILANSPWIQFTSVLEYGVLCAVWYLAEHQKTLREQREREKELRLLNTQMELAMLKSQMNPHFLFNALNTVNALVASNPDAARAVLTKLADVLRYTLDSDRRQYVSFREELDFVQTYLSIEQIRFGERLRVSIDAPAEVMNLYTPPMLLQPLVENAVRHGLAPKDDGGEVRVSVETSGKAVMVAVSDTGVGMTSTAIMHHSEQTGSSGRGLSNTDARLRKLFGEEAGITASTDAAGTRISFQLPVLVGEHPAAHVSEEGLSLRLSIP